MNQLDIFEGMKQRRFLEVQRIVNEKPRITNAKDEYGVSLLQWAVIKGDLDMVIFLLEKGADIHSKDYYGMSVIGHAITRNFIPIASALLRYDTDLESINQEESTALHLACMNGNPNLFELLVEAGGNLHAVTLLTKRTCLHLATIEGHLFIVRFLLQYDPTLFCEDHYGRTPFYYAVYHEHFFIAWILFWYGLNQEQTFHEYAHHSLPKRTYYQISYGLHYLWQQLEITQTLRFCYDQVIEMTKQTVKACLILITGILFIIEGHAILSPHLPTTLCSGSGVSANSSNVSSNITIFSWECIQKHIVYGLYFILLLNVLMAAFILLMMLVTLALMYLMLILFALFKVLTAGGTIVYEYTWKKERHLAPVTA